MEELRREVAGDHTELWGAFQAMLGGEGEGGGGRSLVPPGEDDEEGGGGGRRRLGPEAQAALASVHRHLSSLAEAEDRGTSSQLVKDRQVARERRARARARTDPKPKAEPEVELKPQSKPKAAPKPQSKPKVEPKAQPKVEPKAQLKPKAQPKEQPKQRVKGGGENSGDLRPNAAMPKGAPPPPPSLSSCPDPSSPGDGRGALLAGPASGPAGHPGGAEGGGNEKGAAGPWPGRGRALLAGPARHSRGGREGGGTVQAKTEGFEQGSGDDCLGLGSDLGPSTDQGPGARVPGRILVRGGCQEEAQSNAALAEDHPRDPEEGEGPDAHAPGAHD